jgi:hypothetical protein
MSGAGPNAEGNFTGELNGTFIGEREMRSHAHSQTATMVALGCWEVSWLPGKTMTRSQATTAMVAADLLAQQGTSLTHLSRTHVLALAHWAEELGMIVSQVLTAWDESSK